MSQEGHSGAGGRGGRVRVSGHDSAEGTVTQELEDFVPLAGPGSILKP